MGRLLLLLLLPFPALAADCPARPNGPPMDIDVFAPLPGQPGFAGIGLQGIPSTGTTCGSPPPEVTDVLRGPPAPKGLLRGDGPRDVLHNRPTGTVTISPAP